MCAKMIVYTLNRHISYNASPLLIAHSVSASGVNSLCAKTRITYASCDITVLFMLDAFIFMSCYDLASATPSIASGCVM